MFIELLFRFPFFYVVYFHLTEHVQKTVVSMYHAPKLVTINLLLVTSYDLLFIY